MFILSHNYFNLEFHFKPHLKPEISIATKLPELYK